MLSIAYGKRIVLKKSKLWRRAKLHKTSRDRLQPVETEPLKNPAKISIEKASILARRDLELTRIAPIESVLIRGIRIPASPPRREGRCSQRP